MNAERKQAAYKAAKLCMKKAEAFDIIKSKEMLSVYEDIFDKCFILFGMIAIEIPREEYELLKEVLYE